MPAPTNSDDIIDSRDVIARIDELEDERYDLSAEVDRLRDENAETAGASKDEQVAAEGELADWDLQNGDELTALRALASEAEDYAPDWQHGETLVRESYWPTYAQELVEDVGDLPKNLPSYIVIDWEATADNLKADYTEVDFDGVTYLVR